WPWRVGQISPESPKARQCQQSDHDHEQCPPLRQTHRLIERAGSWASFSFHGASCRSFLETLHKHFSYTTCNPLRLAESPTGKPQLSATAFCHHYRRKVRSTPK